MEWALVKSSPPPYPRPSFLRLFCFPQCNPTEPLPSPHGCRPIGPDGKGASSNSGERGFLKAGMSTTTLLEPSLDEVTLSPSVYSSIERTAYENKCRVIGVEIRFEKASVGLLPTPQSPIGNLASGAHVSSEDGKSRAIKSPSLTLTMVGMF